MMFLTVLGTILKIIGFVLLGILLLLLLFLLVFLFVPLRYRANVVRDGNKLSVQAQVSYLFRLIRLPVNFEDGKLFIRLTVFGIPLYSSGGGGRAKKKKAGKKQGGQEDGEAAPEEGEEGGGEPAGDQAAKEAGSAKLAKGRIKQVSRHAENGGEVAMEEETGTGQAKAIPPAARGEPGEGGAPGPESGSDVEALLGMFAAPEEGEAGVTSTPSAPGEAGAQDTPTAMEEDIPRGPFKLLWKLWRLIKSLINKLRAILEKISNTVQTLKEKISTIRLTVSGVKEKVRLVIAFLRDEENKNGIKYAWKSIFQLLKHVFPYKIEGDIVFATGSPYSMGKALSALGMLYPLYAKPLHLTADFTADHFRLDGRVAVKGRVRFGTVLWIAFKLWRKGKIMHLLSAVKKLKQELKMEV